MGGFEIAACMWIYTYAVLCDGQESTQEFLKQRFEAIRESVSWVCEDAREDHEWVTELTATLKINEVLKALNYEIDVRLWFSSPSRPNQRFADNGTKIAKIP